MQLVTDSRERLARLLNTANTREGLATPRTAGQVAAHALDLLFIFTAAGVDDCPRRTLAPCFAAMTLVSVRTST